MAPSINALFIPTYDDAGNIVALTAANDDTRAYVNNMINHGRIMGHSVSWSCIDEWNRPKKIRTYSSERTRSPRWRAGARSSKPKYNWTKKKRNRNLVRNDRG